ncbi:unnamed protein product [Urochloa humidicola]
MTTYHHKFPHPPPGKYYVVDAGYPNRPGYLSPYKCTRYHVEQFQNGPPPQDENYMPIPTVASDWPEDEPLTEDVNMNAFRDQLAYDLFNGV